MVMPDFRAVIVAAVSTPAQAAEGMESIPEQLRGNRDLCARREWPVVKEIVIPGHSRNYVWLDELMADCPEFADLVQTIRAHAGNIIVTRNYDRLWRTSALQGQVSALCRQHGVQIYDVTAPVEPRPPHEAGELGAAQLIEYLSGYMSESENKIRQVRRRAGMKGRINRGLPGATANPAYGYLREPGEPYIVNPDEAPWVTWMYQRRVEGWGYTRTATELDRLGVPPPSATRRNGHVARYWTALTVSRILSNPIYKGAVSWGPYTNPDGAHVPLIDAVTWEQVQVINSRRARLYDRTANRGNHALSGLMRCGYCDSAMSYGQTRGAVALRCTHYLNSHGAECCSNWHRAEPVEAYVLAAVTEMVGQVGALPVAEPDAARVEALRANVARLEREYHRWDQAFAAEVISLEEFADHRQRLSDERAAALAELDRVEGTGRRRALLAGRVTELSDAIARLAEMAPPEQRVLYNQVIRYVILTRPEPPRIIWIWE